MKIAPEALAIAQCALVIYSVFAVQHRNDRRRVPRDMINALYGVAVFGGACLVLAFVFADAADGRRFADVRTIFEVGFIAATGAVVVALRILKGAPYDRAEKGTKT